MENKKDVADVAHKARVERHTPGFCQSERRFRCFFGESVKRGEF